MYKEELGEVVIGLINDVRKMQACGDLDGILGRLNKMTENPDAIIDAMPDFDCEEVLLYADDDMTVYYIATPPGILYPPHEHCMVAISALYKGTETHVFYDREDGNIKERTRVTVNAPAVVDLDVDAVHAICTHDPVANQGIHFYLGDLEGKKRTLWDVSGNNPRQYVHQDYLNSSRPLE